MNARPLASLGLLSFATLASGCASRGGDPAPAEVTYERGAVVVTGAALQDGPGSLLAAMAGKVPNFRIQRHEGRCPEISLRNNVTFRSFVNPHVYVDGTRTSDTCILESLRTGDVDRVEVYPQGFTHRPGYATHAHGLILVFMRAA